MTRTAEGKGDYAPRRFRIRREDFDKLGHSAGCPGRRAANRGTKAVEHTEECRKGTAEELEKIRDERLEHDMEILLEYLEEEMNKKKKARRSSEGDAKASASSPSSSQVFTVWRSCEGNWSGVAGVV